MNNKNIYVKPETNVVLVEMETMMDASYDKAPNSFSLGLGTETIGEGASVDAKRNGNSLWDFDED